MWGFENGEGGKGRWGTEAGREGVCSVAIGKGERGNGWKLPSVASPPLFPPPQTPAKEKEREEPNPPTQIAPIIHKLNGT